MLLPQRSRHSIQCPSRHPRTPPTHYPRSAHSQRRHNTAHTIFPHRPQEAPTLPPHLPFGPLQPLRCSNAASTQPLRSPNIILLHKQCWIVQTKQYHSFLTDWNLFKKIDHERCRGFMKEADHERGRGFSLSEMNGMVLLNLFVPFNLYFFYDFCD